MTTFFEPGHTYAARVGWSGGRERFRFFCESVTTDSETGKPRALGQHGRLRTADGEWIWTPNPRTYDDWRGGAWTDITDELNVPCAECDTRVPAGLWHCSDRCRTTPTTTVTEVAR